MSEVVARSLSGMTAALVLARLTFKRLLHSRSILVTLTFALLPVAYAFAASKQGEETSLALWRTAFEISLLLLAIGPPLHLAPTVAEEVEGKTYTYLWSRPFPRWSLIVGKLVILVPVLCVLLSAMLAAVFIACFQGTWEAYTHTLINGVIGMSVGVATLSCICVGLGTLVPKHPIAVSLGYVFVIDFVLDELPFALQNLSVSHQVQQIAKVDEYPDPLFPALVWCAGLAAVWLVIALWRVSRVEYSSGP